MEHPTLRSKTKTTSEPTATNPETQPSPTQSPQTTNEPQNTNNSSSAEPSKPPAQEGQSKSKLAWDNWSRFDD